ncbi:MFS transporter [Altererythrobacter fulvus]|uniref:spinster family MFS transporter n=1 Tax=Caenibius fulvus TaxID=2126012 RepID=UPI0030185FD2
MTSESDPSRFLGRSYRLKLVIILFVVCTFNFADRAVFSALAQTIKADLRLSDLELGLLQGIVFAVLYAAVGMPLGLMAERFSRTRIIAGATAIWSAATVATGIAGSFVQLATARLLVGMGEAGFMPTTASMVGDVTPRHRRASTMSLILIGTPAGYLIGAPLAGYLSDNFGWRAAFFAFGIPGVLVALALPFLLPEPPRGLVDGETIRKPAPPIRDFLREVWRTPPLKWVIAGGSLAGFGMTSISQFLAVFLARTHELSVREAAAAYGSVSGISLAIGLLTGGMVTDALSRRDARWPAWGAAIGLTLAVPSYLLAFKAGSLWSAFCMLLVAGALLLLYYAPTTGMIQNLLPARMRASGIALYSLLYTLIGSGLGPVFVGGASDFFGARSYAGNYAVDCPSGLPLAGASEFQAKACTQASASGLTSALSLSVLIFVIAAFCFLKAASGLKAKALAEADQTSA